MKGANIKLKKSSSDTIETEYYGTASASNYKLVTAKDGNAYKITLNYTGKGIAPTIKEGGVIVKIPDYDLSLLSVKGKKGSGLVIDSLNIDTDIVTKDCAVIIKNKHRSNKINIDSKADSYEINSVPMLKKFNLKASGSVVEYTFTEKPLNLKFQLTGGYAELPVGWSRNFTIGSGRPKMTVKTVRGIFELSINR